VFAAVRLGGAEHLSVQAFTTALTGVHRARTRQENGQVHPASARWTGTSALPTLAS
jgi:hypothetical protein